MKTVITRSGLMTRLGIATFALLLGQQALAAGTDAGTTVSNQATVSYDVGTEAQTPIESDPAGNSTPGAGSPTEFLVDRRVSFTLIEVDGAHTTPVAPGQDDVIAAFTLTNTGNAIMDFRLEVVDIATDVHGIPDSTDLTDYRIRVANTDGAGGIPELGDLDFVDELGEEGVVEIYVFANAPLTVLNGQYANIRLTATAADDVNAAPTLGTLDADLAEDPGADDPTEIESVFADTDNNGFEFADDGYEIVSAALSITKTSAVISDDFGSGKALPNAVIEYTVTIDNSGGAAIAENVVMTDTLQIADVTLEDEAYAPGDILIGGSPCNADLGDGDGDGCAYDATTGAMSIDVPDVAAGAQTVITYRVRISPL